MILRLKALEKEFSIKRHLIPDKHNYKNMNDAEIESELKIFIKDFCNENKITNETELKRELNRNTFNSGELLYRKNEVESIRTMYKVYM